ncbi:MAG: FkbM family methyltransferase [Desulfamplus sp.]|nr:FkbM family methyltransferase [Desulfamplus sp.]
MLTFIKNHIRRYPKIKKIFSSLQWKKHIWSDWFNTYINKKNIEFDTKFGFKMIARNYIANRMMMNGTFEIDEIELIQTNLSDVDVFVDVGANIGFYTCIARSLGKYVIAIEPQLQNLECLYANLNNNNWQDTEVFPLGISNKPDLLILYGASGPSASLVGGWAGYSKRFQQLIPVNTLDTLLGDRFIGKKLFIKIDVEGAEYNVLRGALKTLSLSPRPTWFIEICLNEFHPGEINPNYEAIFDLFWQNSYEVRMANKESTLVTPNDIKSWVANKRSGINNFNYLFIPK